MAVSEVQVEILAHREWANQPAQQSWHGRLPFIPPWVPPRWPAGTPGRRRAFHQWRSSRRNTALTRDDILDNITMYWLTNTGVSAARLYWENKADFFDAKPITIPFAISVFPDELYQAPQSWAERAYPHNLIHYNQLDRGGHFAAWEQPQLFSEEMRASFRSLR